MVDHFLQSHFLFCSILKNPSIIQGHCKLSPPMRRHPWLNPWAIGSCIFLFICITLCLHFPYYVIIFHCYHFVLQIMRLGQATRWQQRKTPNLSGLTVKASFVSQSDVGVESLPLLVTILSEIFTSKVEVRARRS